MKRPGILILLTAALLSTAYLVLSYTAAFNQPVVRTQRLEIKDGRFSFYLGALITTGETKFSRVFFTFDQRIDQLEILLSDKTHPSVLKTDYLVTRVSGQGFVVPARPNLQDWLVQGVPRNPSNSLEVKIALRPVIKVEALVFQFLILFFLLVLILTTALLVFNLLIQAGTELDEIIRQVLTVFLVLAATIYLYFLIRLGFTVELWTILKLPVLKILLFTIAFAGLMAAVFSVQVKIGMKPIFWPIIMSLLHFTVFPEYHLRFCGDSVQWVHLAALKEKTIYFAELLSFSWAKWTNDLFNPSSSLTMATQVFTLDAKIIGVVFAFALYAFVRSQKDLAAGNQVIFFVAASVLTMNAFFVGHPEFAFYQLPFLLLSINFAMKYVSSGPGEKFLYYATFFLTIGGLFHGSGYFSAPVLFLLPLLKDRGKPWDKKRILALAINYVLILLIIAAVILAVTRFTAFLGYRISFQNTRGGGDNDRFADFFTSGKGSSWGEKFLDIRYLWERGLTVFLGFPILFFALFGKIRKWKGVSSADLALLLFGLSQMSVFFLWSYDLGFRDFDLLLSPWTVINLFLLKLFLKSFNPEGRIAKGVLFVFLFAVTSGAFLLLFWTTH